MDRPENMCKPPEYPPEMFAEYFESAKKRALRASQIESILGDDYDLDRLRELVEADREGRCFTSHVRVGQTVWFARDPKRNPENIVETTVGKIVYKHSGAYMKLACNSMYETSCNSIGKTVFLTREAAEAALKGEQHEKH